MNKAVLILGGTGFLGKQLTQSLKTTFCVDAFGSALDILDPAQVDQQLSRRRYDYLINATGQITEPINNCRQQNTQGVANLIQLQKKYHFLLVQISTLLIHQPDTDYARLKLKAELMIQAQLPQDQYLIIRLSNLYGPGQKKGLISYLLNQINQPQYKFEFPDNDGTLSRFFLHVDDAAFNINQILTNQKPGVYDLAGPDQYQLRELIDLLRQITHQDISASYGLVKPHGNIDPTVLTQSQFKFKYNLKDFLSASLKNHDASSTTDYSQTRH